MSLCGAAISGQRKLAALLFKNRKRIRIYDMEVEDDDEEEEIAVEEGEPSSDL